MKIERITDLERKYAMESLDGQFETHNNYKFVVRLEKAFAEKIGTKHSVGFVNGTVLIHFVSTDLGGDKILQVRVEHFLVDTFLGNVSVSYLFH